MTLIKVFSPALIGAALLLAACAESSPRGGGMAAEDSFRLIVPHEVSIQQGAVETVNVSLDRGDQFKQDVKLSVKGSPGIGIDPSDSMIKASDTPTALVKLAVAKDAALGDYRVTVTGTPANSGQSTIAEVIVKIVKP